MQTPNSQALSILRANIRNALKRLEWTGKDLAEKAGMKPPQLSDYLNGNRSPRVEVLERIAGVIGVPLGELFLEPKPVHGSVHQKLQDAISLLTEKEAEIVLNSVIDRILALRPKTPLKSGTDE